MLIVDEDIAWRLLLRTAEHAFELFAYSTLSPAASSVATSSCSLQCDGLCSISSRTSCIRRNPSLNRTEMIQPRLFSRMGWVGVGALSYSGN